MPDLASATTVTAAVPLPRDRPCPFAPPDGYRELRERSPVSRLQLADGTVGWLLTRDEDVRAMLVDPRMSAQNRTLTSHVRVLTPDLVARSIRRASLLSMDAPEHSRQRRLLTVSFTARRMRRLTPWIERVVEEHLDAMISRGSPADLVPAFALPIPSLVICELLGVPYAERAEFQDRAHTLVSVGIPPAESVRAGEELEGYLGQLLLRKRAEPADDLLSELARPDGRAGGLPDGELARLSTLLLIAGHETTANMIGLGALMLLEHPARYAALRDGPAVVERTVEELLRYLSVVHLGVTRQATEELTIGGQRISAGELVVGSLAAANHDPERFAEPAELDPDRVRVPHLAFGYGAHQCLGQQLARVELAAAFGGLARRLPGLRLAVPAEQVPLRHEMLIYGVDELPVAW
ncbi:MAG: cytochrome P450 [Actinobacteria bacterium]|nr:cytochrome P450 [Actinomycetota bacterium]MBI3688014.1 cytochrome P450 [Actinomycetota bacterium]